MNLTDLPPRLDDPVESLLDFHRRIERRLAILAGLPVHLETRGVDGEASNAAASLLHCFGAESATHHAEEEQDLIPLLERRMASAQARESFAILRDRMRGDHREMERAWRELRRPLEAIAEGIARRLPGDAIQYFRALHATHISFEEASLHLLALRHLLPEDRTTLAQRIRARRERGPAPG